MTRNGLIAICLVLFYVHGLDSSKRLKQYRHSTWRIRDGFLLLDAEGRILELDRSPDREQNPGPDYFQWLLGSVVRAAFHSIVREPTCNERIYVLGRRVAYHW